MRARRVSAGNGVGAVVDELASTYERLQIETWIAVLRFEALVKLVIDARQIKSMAVNYAYVQCRRGLSIYPVILYIRISSAPFIYIFFTLLEPLPFCNAVLVPVCMYIMRADENPPKKFKRGGKPPFLSSKRPKNKNKATRRKKEKEKCNRRESNTNLHLGRVES